MHENRTARLVGLAMIAILLVSVIKGFGWANHEALARPDYGLFDFLMFWGIGTFVWIWKIVNGPTNWILGDNLFDLFFEVIMLAIFVGLIGSLFAVPAKLVGKVFRRRVAYTTVLAVTAVALVLPHFYMSWSLREYKRDFKERARGSSVEDFSNTEPGESGDLDYGGKLDELVEKRVLTLATHQFIPYGTATWRTNGMTTFVAGAYIYTFLPKSTYEHGLYLVARMFGATPHDAQAALRHYREEAPLILAGPLVIQEVVPPSTPAMPPVVTPVTPTKSQVAPKPPAKKVAPRKPTKKPPHKAPVKGKGKRR